MTSGSLLIVVATVLALDGGGDAGAGRAGGAGGAGRDDRRMQIDKGLVEGLRPGDRGGLFYLLTVGSEEKRIDLGTVEVVAVGEHRATLGSLPDRPAQPGFQVELALPAERLAPAATVAAARQFLGEEAAQRLALGIFDQLGELSELAVPGASAAPPASTAPAGITAAPDLVRIAGGRYWIGSDPAGTTFHNETPRFAVTLAPFEIDRRPTTPPPAGLTYGEAELACTERGLRLPSELEWEVAAQSAELLSSPPALEWTASWYLPYPGNRHPEKEFGETFRVVRGAAANAIPPSTVTTASPTSGATPASGAARQRRFLAPDQRGAGIGFRCARSPER